MIARLTAEKVVNINKKRFKGFGLANKTEEIIKFIFYNKIYIVKMKNHQTDIMTDKMMSNMYDIPLDNEDSEHRQQSDGKHMHKIWFGRMWFFAATFSLKSNSL